MQIVHVIAHFKAKPGKEDSLKQVLTGFIGPTLREAGCLKYELTRGTEDAADFAFIEEWKDHASLDAHLKSPHIQSALPLIKELLACDPDIRRFVVCA